jgi:hypothetical protein
MHPSPASQSPESTEPDIVPGILKSRSKPIHRATHQRRPGKRTDSPQAMGNHALARNQRPERSTKPFKPLNNTPVFTPSMKSAPSPAHLANPFTASSTAIPTRLKKWGINSSSETGYQVKTDSRLYIPSSLSSRAECDSIVKSQGVMSRMSVYSPLRVNTDSDLT